MNQVNQTEAELQARLEDLYWRRERVEVGTDEYNDIDSDLMRVNDDIDAIRRERCEDHMTRTYPQGGYDRCMNCGSKS